MKRVSRAFLARYTGELAALTGDLPDPGPADVALAQRDADTREWLTEWRWWFGGAVIMSTIWGIQAIRSGPGWFWPLVPLGIWAAILPRPLFLSDTPACELDLGLWWACASYRIDVDGRSIDGREVGS